jgi:hypothetical protein
VCMCLNTHEHEKVTRTLLTPPSLFPFKDALDLCADFNSKANKDPRISSP